MLTALTPEVLDAAELAATVLNPDEPLVAVAAPLVPVVALAWVSLVVPLVEVVEAADVAPAVAVDAAAASPVLC
ncbi:MAG: hypothetical protein JST54_13195 [Deltaproteobacteria bacterium]|nr:hypothetical protein [Deltaproteobacteria bacterium]